MQSPDASDDEGARLQAELSTRVHGEARLANPIADENDAVGRAARVPDDGVRHADEPLRQRQHSPADGFPCSCAVRDDEVEGGQRGPAGEASGRKRAEPVTLVGQIHVHEIGLQLAEPAAKPERGSRMGNTAQPGYALDGRARRDQALVDLARRSISEQGVEPATIAQGCNERLEIQLRATDASGIGYECYERVVHVLPASRVRPDRRIECTARELRAPGSPDGRGTMRRHKGATSLRNATSRSAHALGAALQGVYSGRS